MWTDKYVGIPYVDGGRDMDGLDCLGLMVLVCRERHDRAFPDPGCDAATAHRRGEIEKHRPKFKRVDRAQVGDVVVIRMKGRPLHVGYALNHRTMLHADRDVGVCIEDFTAPRWAGRVEGIYRFA